MRDKTNILYALVGVTFMIATALGGGNVDSNILKLSITAEAGGGTCGGNTAGRSCAIVASYGPADANNLAWQSDICYGYNGITDADSFSRTCSEIAAETGCAATGTCDRYYQTEYRVQRRSCQSTTDGSICSDCTSSSFAFSQCENLGGGTGGGGGGSAPTVDLVANPVTVGSGGSSTLTWTVSNATSCSASASPASVTWSGNKSSSGGTQSTGAITANTTYTLTCTNGTSNASDSATVTVGGPVVNFDLLGGVTAPYTQSVTGNNPLNGVDAQFNVNIASGCAASCDFDSNGFYICDYQCSSLQYQLRCNSTDSWKSFPSATRYDPQNGINYNRTFTNQCDYTDRSQMEGRIVITKSYPYSQTTYEDVVPITVTTPPGASCAPLTQNVEVGQPATVIGTPSGQSPLTCSWTGGGDPATSNLCNPFTTTYSTPGTKTITFNVNAANGTASCQSTVNVVNAASPNATVDVTAGTTTPYANFVSAESSVNNVDVSLAGNITSGCGSAGDTNLNKCSVEYRVDCDRDNPSNPLLGPFTYNNVSNGTNVYVFDNACNYSGPNTYYIRGEMTVIKNSDSTARRLVVDEMPVYITAPVAVTTPTVTLTANPASVSSGQSSTLTWTVSNATSCTASGDWSGSKSVTGGNELQTNITANKSYTLTCSNSGGSTPATATVTVTGGSPSTSGSCSAVNPTVNVGETASFVGTATGPSPIRCQWQSTGGTPANSGLLSSTVCGSYSTTYSTPGTKTVMYVVNTPERQIYPTCSVTVVDNTPTPTYTLTTVRNGQGTITSDLPGINCGSTCTGVYDEGTAVVLTATPAAGWSFIEWLGDCAATAGNTCTVQVNGPRTVTAKFRPNTIYEEF